MKYDDASWHYGGDFPADLPPEAGATHIAMFVAWAMLNGLAGTMHTETFPNSLPPLKNRETTPGAWFISECDEKFVDEELNVEGNEFAKAYYDNFSAKEGAIGYLTDYLELFAAYETVYHVPDNWDSYDKVEPMVVARFKAWRDAQADDIQKG